METLDGAARPWYYLYMDGTLSTYRPVERKIYSISELTRLIRELLESTYPFVWVRGEISNFRDPGSGHFYFTLKDDAAQIRAVMFKGQNRNLKFTAADGLSVIGLGRIAVYEPQGVYQIVLEHLEPFGIGALALAFEQLKEKLNAEGLFDPRHKKALPFPPKTIGVVTSPTGAVIHDILRVAQRRFPNISIVLAPAKVQGSGAAEEIAQALKILNDLQCCDVLILARGGGSLEDLAAFNSELVARAVFASEIPVVSGVGHETDFTIADFVADLRAPTPSAAAELVVPEKASLQKRVQDQAAKLGMSFQRMISLNRISLDATLRRLAHPRRKLQDLIQKNDGVTMRLAQALQRLLSVSKDKIQGMDIRLNTSNPLVLSNKYKVMLELKSQRLSHQTQTALQDAWRSFTLASGKISTMDPMAVLRRGYSITRNKINGRVLTDSGRVSLGQDVEVTLFKGSLLCRVEGKADEQKNQL